MGAAMMVTDRFAALTPMNASYPATVTLRPVDLTGVCALTANVDSTAGGSSLRVELMSKQGYVIDGFSKANATALAGVSAIDAPLAWAAGALPLSDPALRSAVMLRAHLLGGARLFAFGLRAC